MAREQARDSALHGPSLLPQPGAGLQASRRRRPRSDDAARRRLRRRAGGDQLPSEGYEVELPASLLLSKPTINRGGALAPFRDRPDDQRLAAARVAAREAAVARAGPSAVGDVAARIQLQAKVLDDPFRLRVEEAHREQHQLSRDFEL